MCSVRGCDLTLCRSYADEIYTDIRVIVSMQSLQMTTVASGSGVV